MIDLTIVAGARPNFMKIASIIRAIEAVRDGQKLTYRLVHTGQHYDEKLSGSFFNDLQLPRPDINLEVGSGTHAEQTADIMTKFEKYLMKNKAKYVLVVGDVNSTLACSIVAKKLNVKVIHVEGGLRSGDQTMPEEINRLVTDSISDLFFTTTESASRNLLKEGHSKDKIYLVGNTMIDTLVANQSRYVKPPIFDDLQLAAKSYVVLTLHRPSNVDKSDNLMYILNGVNDHVNGKKIIFPVHPRTAKALGEEGTTFENIILLEPMRYLEFMYLIKNSFAVVTDSGGIQEETTYFKIPCITLRDSTERPETAEIGTNELCNPEDGQFRMLLERLGSGSWKKGEIPNLWDGKAGDRIVSVISDLI